MSIERRNKQDSIWISLSTPNKNIAVIEHARQITTDTDVCQSRSHSRRVKTSATYLPHPQISSTAVSRIYTSQNNGPITIPSLLHAFLFALSTDNHQHPRHQHAGHHQKKSNACAKSTWLPTLRMGYTCMHMTYDIRTRRRVHSRTLKGHNSLIPPHTLHARSYNISAALERCSRSDHSSPVHRDEQGST